MDAAASRNIVKLNVYIVHADFLHMGITSVLDVTKMLVLVQSRDILESGY